MKALVIDEYSHACLTDWPEPELGPDQVLLKVHFSGVSAGTERWMGTGAMRDPRYGAPPFVPGYQASGEVVARGSRVADLAVGDLVVAFAPGSHAAYVQAPRSTVHAVPAKRMTDIASLFVQPSVGANALNQAMVAAGDSVLVIGQGLVGQMTAQLARLRGAHVMASDISPVRLSMSKRYCADSVVDASAGPIIEQVSGRVPSGFDVVIESIGMSSLLDDALALVTPGGRFVFVGWHSDRVQFVFNHPHAKQIRAFFPSGIGPTQVANGVLGLMARGDLRLRPLITHTVQMQDAASVYNQLFTPESDQINAMVIDWRSSH